MLDLFRKYRTPLLVGALLLTALLFYSANLRTRGQTNILERMVIQLMSPFLGGIDATADAVVSTWNSYVWLVDTEAENDSLVDNNRKLKAELSKLREVVLANERLRSLLEFKEREALPAIPAEVVAEDASSWFRTVMIDKGSEEGIAEGMPVVVSEGAVGRIIRVSQQSSRVLLLTDASSAVASLVQKSRTRGISRGRGDFLTFDFALRQERIEVGDMIVSSGMGGIFPKGLSIGQVRKVVKGDYGLFQTVELTPSVDFDHLEEVLVLLKEKP